MSNSQEYYNHGNYPQQGTVGSSAALRSELEIIEAGLNKLPALTGNPNKLVKVSADGSGLEASTVISDNGTDATIAGDMYVAGGQIGQNAAQKHNIPLVANDTLALLAATQTLTNKSLNLLNNAVTGTLAQFNAALSDADFVSLAGAESLTNKAISAATNTITTAASGGLVATNLNAALAELDAEQAAYSASLAASTGSSLVGSEDKYTTTYLKTLSDIINGSEVSITRFIPASAHAAIRNNTSSYDATAALTEAFNAPANAATPVINLYIPAGTILHAGNITGRSGVNVRGGGWLSKLKLINGSNPTTSFTFGSETAQCSVELRDFEIDGNKANNPTSGDGLKIIRGYKANTHNLRVKNCKGNGLTHSATASAFENYNYSPSFYDNDGYGVQMVGAGMTDTHILGGDIGYNGLGGVVLRSDCSVKQATVWGGGLPNSIGVTAGYDSQVFGCNIEGHGKHGISVTSGVVDIQGNKIYANSFNTTNSGLFDGINVAAGANIGSILGNKIFSSISAADPHVMRNAVRFEGAHDSWTIAGNDMAQIGALATGSTGEIVFGVLPTDKCDFNWIKTNVVARRSVNVSPSVANAWTVFPYDAEDSDVRSELVGGAFTPKSTGLYRIHVVATFTATAINENIGLSLFTTAGVEIRRIDFKRAENVNSEMLGGTVEEWLTAGVSYDLRYFTGATTTTFLAGNVFTYAKIRAVAN